MFYLSPQTKRKTLFVDLDDTLIKSMSTRQYNKALADGAVQEKAEFSICIKKSKGGFEHRHVFLRRGLRPFLKEIARLFDVVLYTTSIASYAVAIVDHIDPNREVFSNLLTRVHCLKDPRGSGAYLKDLTRIMGRDHDQMLLLDDSREQVNLNKDNAIRIPAFEPRIENDTELESFASLA